MNQEFAKADFGRRAALQAGMAALGATLASQAGTQSAAPQKSRLREYAWVTGFNYQPSWGSHGITIWNDFRPAVFAREVDLGLKHFPKINVLRIWLSYDAWIADRTKFLSAVKQAAGILAERKLRMIPVFFNGWVALVYFGGFNLNQLSNSARNRNFGAHRQYLRETLEALRPSGNLLMYDISNEPFNQGGKEAGSVVVDFLRTMAEQIRTLDRKTPVSVGTIGIPSRAGGPEDLDLVDPFVDVHVVHPYRLHERAEEFAGMVAHLERLGKPAIATECCWGSNDDATRAGYVRHDLTLLKRTGIGFLPHALHHSRVADLHRPVPGRDWNTMYMGFIDPGGSIRPGHEVYNEFCD